MKECLKELPDKEKLDNNKLTRKKDKGKEAMLEVINA